MVVDLIETSSWTPACSGKSFALDLGEPILLGLGKSDGMMWRPLYNALSACRLLMTPKRPLALNLICGGGIWKFCNFLRGR